jgi:hypothetical protein
MADDLLPYSIPSGNIEDRRTDVPDWWLMQKRPPLRPSDVVDWMTPSGPYPLQYEAGYGQIGEPQPQQQPQGNAPFYGPMPPTQTFSDALKLLELRRRYGMQEQSGLPTPLSEQVPSESAPSNSEAPFEIHSPTKIRLGPEAKAWAEAHGMTLTEMARWLLAADAQRQAGMAQRQGEN